MSRSSSRLHCSGVLFLGALLLAGCRFTNGWGIVAQGPGEPGTTDSGTPSVDGIWTGTLALADDGGTHDAIAAVWDGKLLAVSPDGDAAFAGAAAPPAAAATVAGADLAEGEVRGYDAAGVAQEVGILTGTVTAAESLTATVADTGRDGELDLAYDGLVERGTGLSQFEGSWSRTRDGETLTLTVSVGTRFTIEGSSTNGCTFSGQLLLLRSDRNLYRLELTAENCGDDDGSYTGLSYLDPDASPQEWVALAERDEQDRFWWARLDRQ